MTRFFVRRVLLGAFVMFCVTVIVYLIFYVGPGPGYVARALAGREAPPQTVALIAHRLLLDRPWYAQYGHFLFQLLQGNLGYDYYHGQSVNSIIAQAFPVTLSLTVGAATIWVTIGVLSGIASAVRPRSLLDRGATFTALIFYSMPTFVLGLLILELFYYQLTVHGLRWFPGSGYTPPTQSIFEWFRGLSTPLVHPRLGLCGHLHPSHPCLDARRPGRGLHPHGARQGSFGVADHLPSRPARRARRPLSPSSGSTSAPCSVAR